MSGSGPFSSSPIPDARALTVQLQDHLAGLAPEQLERIFELAGERREEDGVYFGSRDETQQDWSFGDDFDLMPLVIAGEEWSRLEAGLIQRVRAWNLFLRDVYSGQEILKAGVVPYEIVYADPNFHRGCARLAGVTSNYLQLTAFDLQQDERGRWLVVEEHLGVAQGASYALKKRQLMRQVAPRLFDGAEILPIEDFAAQVMDVLREQVRSDDGRVRGVLLSQGSDNEHYLDHANLARQMGVSIVQGTDLVVLDSRLYLKTIAGIDRVDVVLRRLATSFLDPVTFDGSSRFGVPGLLSCVRKGELVMANGMGADLADNRALAIHLPSIIEYYLNEKALLGAPHGLEMRDVDVRVEVSDNRDNYAIRHAWKRGAAFEWMPRSMSAQEWDALWQQIEAAPAAFVAHRPPVPMLYPAWTASGARPLPARLRAFGLGQHRVSPCALAWTGGALSASMIQASNRIKDVWILRTTSVPQPSVHAQAEETPKRLRLTSRVAEALFWMGRYAERAEVTTRALRVVQMQAWPAVASSTARERQPLWAALAALSGHPTDFFVRPDKEPVEARDVPFYLLLDAKNGSSVVSSLLSCRDNAEDIREHLPPEVWSVLNRLYLHVAFEADHAETEEVRQSLEDRSLHGEILRQLDELSGALEKHMLYNDARHFWQLGVCAERGFRTLLTMQQVLAPGAGEEQRDPVSSSNLDLLLQILAGQYAYRSLYHARPVAARVARLLLQDEEFPRSALYCLHGMRRALRATFGEQPGKGAETPLRHCGRVISELNEIDIANYFPRIAGTDSFFSSDDDLSDVPTPALRETVDRIVKLLLEFNVLISDHYLDHQVVFREPELFDLSSSR